MPRHGPDRFGQGWRGEGRERAFVRFETAPGQQAQMDWSDFGNWDGKRLYGFALTLAWSRMQYVEFTQRQDMETMLNCMVHAFSYFGGVTAAILTDNMKTWVVDRIDGKPCFHARLLDFASYYGFVPRVCHPYRPETKGKIESTIRFIKSSFWPGIGFETLPDLNRQALAWCEQANPMHYGSLPRKSPRPPLTPVTTAAELTPGPGVGLHFPIPEVELRPLSIYQPFCESEFSGDISSSLGWREPAYAPP